VSSHCRAADVGDCFRRRQQRRPRVDGHNFLPPRPNPTCGVSPERGPQHPPPPGISGPELQYLGRGRTPNAGPRPRAVANPTRTSRATTPGPGVQTERARAPRRAYVTRRHLLPEGLHRCNWQCTSFSCKAHYFFPMSIFLVFSSLALLFSNSLGAYPLILGGWESNGGGRRGWENFSSGDTVHPL
jgi:hypothetical protein